MPTFSIVTPVYNPPREAFEACVRSVLGQSHPDWEWCLADDASTADWVSQRLRELQTQDVRIRVVERQTNGGIVAASNDAIAVATGEFLVLLDNDDELHLDALRLIADAIAGRPDCDYLYSDENKMTADGEHFDVFAKPTWSPERLLAQNFTSHLSVLRRSVVEQVGRFRQGFDGSQDYDLILRVVERARAVVHVPHVLYHWRSLPTSTASAASAKPYAFVAALKAVREHLSRTGTVAEVTEAGPSLARIRRVSTHNPRVTVVIPVSTARRRIFGVETPLARNVTRSLLEKTTYNNYSVVLAADTRLSDDEIDELASPFETRISVVRVPGTFSLAQGLNAGLLACSTPIAALVDERCEFIDGDWIETLLGYAGRDGVAMVAPILVDEYGTILSAGLAMTPEPHDIAQGRHTSDLGPVGMYAIARECFGVSTRCALVDTVALKRVGGFSPDYAGRWFDADLACKLHDIGRHAIVTPLARVRSHDDPSMPGELDGLFAERWGRFMGRDPYTRFDTRFAQAVDA